jgi:uncharacterized protein YwqG
MDLDALRAAASRAGLASVSQDLAALAQPSIRLLSTPAAGAELAVGASRLGGQPDLPAGVAWPLLRGAPMAFIAQIALAALGPYDVQRALPPAGMLWFFYDAQQQTFGADPADRGGWHVLYRDADGATPLRPAPFPPALPAAARYTPCTLSARTELTLPQRPATELTPFTWTPEQQSRYEALLATRETPAERAVPHNRLLGHPDALGDDMRLECQLAANGVSSLDDPRVAALSPGAHAWRLLLQVDSDEHAGMRWGNNGLLYFWIERDALAARRFENVWLVLQSE